MTKPRGPRHYMKEWRLERDITQKALAEMIGSTKSLISRYEQRSINMGVEVVFKACEALNIGLEEFYDHPKRAERTHARLRAIHRFHRRMHEEDEDN